MTTIGGKDIETIQKLLLDASQYKKEITDVAKLERKLQREEKNIEFVRKQLEKTTNNLSTATKKYVGGLHSITSKMISSIAKGNLLSSAIQSVGSELLDAAKDAAQFAIASKSFTGDMESAKEATKGLVSELDLMQAKNRLNTLGVKMSAKQYSEMLKSLTIVSRTMGRDLKSALEDITTALARQSTQVADNIGITMKISDAYDNYAKSIGKTSKELTASEKRTAFQTEALKQLNSKAQELGPTVDLLSDKLSRLGIRFRDFGTEVFAFWDEAIGKAIDNLDRLGKKVKMDAAIMRDDLTMVLKLAGVDLEKEIASATPKLGTRRIELEDKSIPDWLQKKTSKKTKSTKRAGKRKTSAYDTIMSDSGDSSRKEAADLLREFQDMGEKPFDFDLSGLDLFAGKVDVLSERLRYNAEMQEKVRQVTEATGLTFQDVGQAALVSFSSSILGAIDAAMQGQTSFGEALLASLKQITMNLSSQLLAKGIAAQFEASALMAVPWTAPLGAAYQAQASIYFAGAAALGAGAIGLSAASAAVSSTSSTSGGVAAANTTNSYRPESSRSESKSKQPIHISLYLGNKGDLGARAYIKRELQADIQGL